MQENGKYHISKDGIVRPCTARIGCRLGGPEIHFNTIAEANRHVNEMNADEYGVMAFEDASSISEDLAQETYVDNYSVNAMKSATIPMLTADIDLFNKMIKSDEYSAELKLELYKQRDILSEYRTIKTAKKAIFDEARKTQALKKMEDDMRERKRNQERARERDRERARTATRSSVNSGYGGHCDGTGGGGGCGGSGGGCGGC